MIQSKYYDIYIHICVLDYIVRIFVLAFLLFAFTNFRLFWPITLAPPPPPHTHT